MTVTKETAAAIIARIKRERDGAAQIAPFNKASDKRDESSAPQSESGGDETERLAALSPIEYDVEREDAAKRLGIRVTTLDKMVNDRRRAEKQDDSGQGRAIKIPDLEPWPEPVDGGELATMLSNAIRQYVVIDATQADAIALWLQHSWTVNHFQISPRLAFYSPTMGCGKTTALSVISKLARRAMLAISISPAAVFRVMESVQPTLIIDELKKFLETGSEMHGLLNAGHGKGMDVVRVLGDQLELRTFKVFGAVAVGTLGSLPDDLQDRAIVIKMQRKLASDTVAQFRDDRADHLLVLARKCARWAADNGSKVADVDPDMPGLANRAADNWRPLFAIAQVNGGGWPGRVIAAAKALAGTGGESIGETLLVDLQHVFEEAKATEMHSAAICDALHKLEGRPWVEFGKAGRPITQNQLARLLKPFGVIPDRLGSGENRARGYLLTTLDPLFGRYRLGGDSQPSNRPKRDEITTSGDFEPSQTQPSGTVAKCEKPNNDGVLDTWTVANGGSTEADDEDPADWSEARLNTEMPLPPDDFPEMPENQKRVRA
jgi:putative DNA primase/helicase